MATSRSALEKLLTRVARDEAELSFPSFDHDDAWQLGRTIRRRAREESAPIAIDVRIGEQQVFHAALAGSTADNDEWIERKIRTTWRFATSSLAVRVRRDLTDGGFEWLDPTVYAVSGGCVPIRVGGAIVGTATVSGLPDHEDHALVAAGMRDLLGASGTSR